MRFRNPDNKTSDNSAKGGSKRETKREAPRKLKADDQPRYKGKSDSEVAADLERRFGPIKTRR